MSILKQIAEGKALEQIDEISKKLAARYTVAASNSLSANSYDAGRGTEKPDGQDMYRKGIETSFKRLKGIEKATKKLAKEEVELDEGNAANKAKKNAHVAGLGAKSLHIDDHEDAHFRASMSADASGSSKEHATKKLVGSMKRAGRHEIKHPSKKEEYHAHYDKKAGVYHIKHTATDKIVDHNVANSGGAALSHAANWNKKSKVTEALEEARHRGRPRKARHEDGKIVNDPDANLQTDK